MSTRTKSSVSYGANLALGEPPAEHAHERDALGERQSRPFARAVRRPRGQRALTSGLAFGMNGAAPRGRVDRRAPQPRNGPRCGAPFTDEYESSRGGPSRARPRTRRAAAARPARAPAARRARARDERGDEPARRAGRRERRARAPRARGAARPAKRSVPSRASFSMCPSSHERNHAPSVTVTDAEPKLARLSTLVGSYLL